MSWPTSMRLAPSSRMVPAGSSAFATATSSSDRSRTAFSVSAYVAMGGLRRPLYRIPTNRLGRARSLDPENRGRLRLELDRGVVDAEAGVQDRVERLEQSLAVTDVVHDDVGAHGLALRGEGPHVQVVHAADARHRAHRVLDLGQIQMSWRPLEQDVDRLLQKPPRARDDDEPDGAAHQG